MTTTQQKNKKYYEKENQHIVEEIRITKDLTQETTKGYRVALSQYSEYHQQTIQELLDEADNEEEQHIRMKRRKIKHRIISFRQHLLQQGKKPSTINTHTSRIKATYRFYEIELPDIPKLKSNTHETIEDLPTKKHIRKALQNTNNLGLKALILFMSSSGTARQEASSITVQDFINATSQYHNEVNIKNVVQILENKDNIVPTFHIVRQKTQYPYITFCSPEATQAILLYLKHRIHPTTYYLRITEPLTPDSKLFHFALESINKHFQRLNDKLGWGWKGTRRFFHPHALRKFFATELLKTDMDSMTIDFLSGRTISSTHQAYFKADPKRLKQKYMQFMNQLLINEKIVYKDVKSYELEELEQYRAKENELNERLRNVERMFEDWKRFSTP